jgi:hypothetical protein
MTTDLSESVTGSTELVFPDDANGQYRLRERTVYDADEVRTELETDIPKYGVWLPVEIDGDDAWLSAPSELRSTLVEDEVRAGELFEIVTMRQDGIDQSDPYKVEVQYPESDETAASQQSLA